MSEGEQIENSSERRRDDRPEVAALFRNLCAARSELELLLEEMSGHWGYEDPVYRFYHQSMKVYHAQSATLRIVERLKALAPDRKLNAWFTRIVESGTQKKFSMDVNRNWIEETRPILEAFFHARYFLAMAVRYARDLNEPPLSLPSGWAALLYLYDLR